MTSPLADLLSTAIARDPAAPLITYYDDATDERTELSGTTLANWVAKTANLLYDGLDVAAGEHLAVLLPAHWQTAAVLVASWSVGAVVTPDVDDADVLVVDEAGLQEWAEADMREILGLPLRPMAGRLFDRPETVTDYAAEIAAYGDHFAAAAPVPPDAPARRANGRDISGAELVAAAHEHAGELGLVVGDRLLVDADQVADGDALGWLLAPLAAGASVVLCRHADPSALPQRAAAERCTGTLGVTVAGIRRHDAG